MERSGFDAALDGRRDTMRALFADVLDDLALQNP
jgi:hypothetical protein